ncbi:iron ABC transporter permease [Heyndrickxia sporothermodurans]|uniref:FecCD family ABC transporter permease n=1 Tax=Heyndrickxia TaxID=2837504 RepID=UPI000D35EFB5|nr:iron ABC transporter permease [Heyndrickxia sporothermodurans]MEB6548775.1 iron ABC transporter permease [Heyndrickxia sporothermodurans]MED3655642.1 iron ABC transporter permease [Heyndrickxia sporothermodurans]MED3780328.1 iron ABC transporter permease [Heyndrickxia sporothermodurans]PTY80734.1 iron ABC transporter [Heyndrickxia sporothermodurans]
MVLKKNWQKLFAMIIATIILLLLIGMSIVFGYTGISIKTAIQSFMDFNGSNEHVIITSVRLPRALIAAAVGACLAMSGVIMQTLTKNPLAAPEILGLNAGASFAVVLAVTLFHFSSLQAFAWASFTGAAIATIGVFLIGSVGNEGLTPMKLTLAGAAIAALFASFTQGLLSINEAALEQVLFWLAGSVANRKLDILTSVFPYMLIGWIIALVFAKKMNVLSMGEDVAKGLGLKTGLVKIGSGVVVILLAGSAVAVAGPIGFVGIVIPHIARKIIGIDHRWLLPLSGILGGVLLVAADIASRYVIMPQEVPVGVMTAIIGVPFFIYIARRGFNGR